jgi:hypothetical protein
MLCGKFPHHLLMLKDWYFQVFRLFAVGNCHGKNPGGTFVLAAVTLTVEPDHKINAPIRKTA